MKGKKVSRKSKTTAKKAPGKKPLEELSPEDLERVAGGAVLSNWGRRIIKRF